MDCYVTFESYIDAIVKSIENRLEDEKALDSYGKDTSQLIDNIIRSAMAKRTSDIHIEPMEEVVRVRYRIDGELIVVANIEKSKQPQIIRKIKINFKYAPRSSTVAGW